MKIICDTNVWYDIAGGGQDPAVLKSDGRKLLFTPVSFIELASKVDADTFSVRSDAAKAVLKFADEVPIDPERHFAELWGLQVDPVGIDWLDALKTLADAPDFATFERGVPDPAAGVRRILHTDFIAGLREPMSAFAEDIEKLIDSFFPGYLRARRGGRAKYAGKDAAQPFADATQLPDIENLVVLGTRERAALNVDGHVPTEPSEEERLRVAGLLKPYVRAYSRYVLNCATRYTPKPNDWGDLECFAYLQGGNRLLTRDARWLEIADEAGLSSWLFDPEHN